MLVISAPFASDLQFKEAIRLPQVNLEDDSGSGGEVKLSDPRYPVTEKEFLSFILKSARAFISEKK